MINITLNNNEQNTLFQLLDVATKASGLQGAEAALYFVNKIRDAQPKQEVKDVTEEATAND